MKGGKRKGAGRKKSEPTITISFRVKAKDANELKVIIKNQIETYANNRTKNQSVSNGAN